MSRSFEGWGAVCEALRARSLERDAHLNRGQRASLAAIADRFEGGAGNRCRGVVIADEVGMGKTRVASAVARAVVDSGGRVAILVPPGLGYQWTRELRGDDLRAPELLRSLWGYLRAFQGDGGPAPWHDEPLLLISHLFANWRMGPRTYAWRWGLLPAVAAEARKLLRGRYPNRYSDYRRHFGDWTITAARAIVRSIKAAGWGAALTQLQALSDQGSWRQSFCDAGAYRNGSPRRGQLETAVGWGLGRFELVIIDEAHKARGHSSGLSRLARRVVHRRRDASRLALTATPVAMEIDEWDHTLSRVGVSPGEREAITATSRRYAAATSALRRTWRTSEDNRAAWRQAARDFERALRPYVIRRDKREDDGVQLFSEQTSQPDAYRRLIEVTLSPGDLALSWRRVIFGAEALSATVHGGQDPLKKRLRLTLANGHGVASLIDSASELSAAPPAPPPLSGDEGPAALRALRAALWEQLICAQIAAHAPAASGQAALWDHPQLRAAAGLLDEKLAQGHKVLVFGRFTRPMHALRDLLNARARVRALLAPGPEIWPQERVWEEAPDGSRRLAEVDRAAARQLGLSEAALEAAFVDHLQRYRQAEAHRRWLRQHLFELLELGLAGASAPGWAGLMLQAARGSAGEGGAIVAALTRATWELLSPEVRSQIRAQQRSEAVAGALAEAFVALMAAAVDTDSFEETEDDEPELTAAAKWGLVQAHITEEFSTQRGGLARTLDGGTGPATRRLLQAAFNREHSFPRVLIAQSVVGREGLNLHEACRVVVLLHPEWNPGVVEQQIGRIDRIGSRWQRELEAAVAQGAQPEALPCIEVLSLVFRGTYDEHNWRVLHRRWASLRAQLHGVVIPAHELTGSPELRALAEKLNEAAPDFSPLRAPPPG
jgi:hypothetical protein